MAFKVTDFLKKVKESTGITDVSRDQKLLSSFTSAGAVKGKKPAAVIRPHSSDEVKNLVELAASENVNLVFFSSPPPRFNGGCIPQSEGVMVDMSKMNKIVRIDRRNKVALIEPGVSYEALQNLLGRRQTSHRALMRAVDYYWPNWLLCANYPRQSHP